MQQRSPKSGAPGLSAWKWMLLPLMLAVIALCYLWAGDLTTFPGDAKSPRIIFWHVPMAILSLVWFAVSAWYSARLLWKGQPFDDTRAEKAAGVGLLLTVLATVTGAVFSKMQWGGGLATPWYHGYWQWDPKQTAILVVILVFLAYFGLRAAIDDPTKRARLAAVYALLGAASVPFFYWVMPLLPGNSTHPTDTIRQGMDVPYRVVFYLSTLTFMGVTLWAYQLQIRAARLLERQEAAAEVPAGPRTEAVRVDRPALGDTP